MCVHTHACAHARVYTFLERKNEARLVGGWPILSFSLISFCPPFFFLFSREGFFLWKKRFCGHFETRRYIYPALRSLDERCQHTGVSASGEHYPPPRQFNFANQSGIAALRELLAASSLLLRFQLKLRAKPSCELLLAK